MRDQLYNMRDEPLEASIVQVFGQLKNIAGRLLDLSNGRRRFPSVLLLHAVSGCRFSLRSRTVFLNRRLHIYP